MTSQTGKQPRVTPLRVVIMDLCTAPSSARSGRAAAGCSVRSLLFVHSKEAYQRWLSRERHALRVVLEIYKTIAVVQLQLKQPEHCKSQKTGNLRPGVAAHGGEV
jgi:hypothetical protein